jgi:hypothetical protein
MGYPRWEHTIQEQWQGARVFKSGYHCNPESEQKNVGIQLKIYFDSREPNENYKLKIGRERLLKFRVNDLIDPFPVPLEETYALVIEAEEPVVIQFLRMNTGQKNLAIMGTIAFGNEL